MSDAQQQTVAGTLDALTGQRDGAMTALLIEQVTNVGLRSTNAELRQKIEALEAKVRTLTAANNSLLRNALESARPFDLPPKRDADALP